MKNWYALLFTVIALTSTTLFGQNDPNAKKVLDGLSEKIKSSKGISVAFSLKSITAKGKPNGTKTGKLSLKGSKYYLKQGKNEIICDGLKVYNYDGNKTITVSSVEESDQTLSPQKLLSGSYGKDFIYKLASSNGKYNQIELIPVDKRKAFQKVILYIDKKQNFITKADIIDKSNNTTEAVFSNVNTNAVLTDNLFVFNKSKYPSDVDILD
ncbi:MAG: outer membrane lipoprotein carrier protein LolA [Bacteroidetes bacterium]|nr:outer membrane lipoprotein carrier protein LolA [Bacteroidota bacterium]MBS1671966.1 outer membrane lipoprotein carrier protein LolA [Bacteroidota bacterium]